MKLKNLSSNWSITAALIVLTAILFWGYGCPARTQSLITEGKKVTRPELQIELDSILATAEFRLADLDKQDAVRDLVFQNVVGMIEKGTVNPLGILTLLTGLYGAMHGVKHLKDRIERS